jgi:hypothetical protein
MVVYNILIIVLLFLLTVPPSISDSLSSSDAIVREGANVSLTCHVDGYPKPDIKWKRDDGLQININKTLNGKDSYEMSTLATCRFNLRTIEFTFAHYTNKMLLRLPVQHKICIKKLQNVYS